MAARTTLVAILACLAGAACDALGPDHTLFPEERLYTFEDPDCVETDPELPCSAEVRFCPDGTADYRPLGSDIVRRGSYQVIDDSLVQLILNDDDARVFFTVLDEGVALRDNESGREWVLATDSDACAQPEEEA